ncbi:MAG TPA: 30S ribosomal protein S4 [Candidatus Avanaerovorax faecigallinarum]|jgi:small subunit ribosomal protein S4|nr:30S ribosomal protein S4 [Candidatus Avanaerovorax faecigallinarum]
MAVNRTPVLKRCRSLGIDPAYLGISKKSKRQVKRTNRKMSEYGLQLREKQKAKFIYGILEKPFRNYYEKAKKMSGITGTNLMVLLECRLDNVIFRLGLAATRKEARQLIVHGHFTVNGKKVSSPGLQVKPGDVIKVKEASTKSPKFKEIRDMVVTTPSWLTVDVDKLEGKVLSVPERDEIDTPVEEQLIVELYSK